MRISDWSSDVCSSDLSKIAILSGGGDVENAGAITGASGGVYIQGTALDSDDRSGVTGSLANSGAIRGTGDFGGSDGDGYGVGRSEEHTSELQSLLRISYAVFCLKKKRYTIYTQITDTDYIHNTQPHQTQAYMLHKRTAHQINR